MNTTTENLNSKEANNTAIIISAIMTIIIAILSIIKYLLAKKSSA